MSTPGFTLFETPIGVCALCWGERGIHGSQLPESNARHTRTRMHARFPETPEIEPTNSAQAAINGIVALLRGQPAELRGIQLDWTSVSEFHYRVYEITREIPPGETSHYGDIARKLNSPGSAQAVGNALGANPFAPIVPCHRVLAAGGKLGGFSANGGTATKRRMLEIESRHTTGTLPLFD